MNFLRTSIPDHLNDLYAGGTAHEAIIHQHNALAFNLRSVGRVFQFNTKRTDLLCWLNKRAAHIVVADDAKLKRNTAFGCKTKSCRNTRIWYRNDHIRFYGTFLRQHTSKTLTNVINGMTVQNTVRAGEVDVLKDIWAGRALAEWEVAFDTTWCTNNNLTVLNFTNELRADDIQCTSFTRKNRCTIQITKNQWANSIRVTRTNQLFTGQCDKRVSTFHLANGLDEAIYDLFLARTGNQLQNHFTVRCRLANRTVLDQLTAYGHRIGKVAVMTDCNPATIKLSKQRLHIAQCSFTSGGVAHMADCVRTLQVVDGFLLSEMITHKTHMTF